MQVLVFDIDGVLLINGVPTALGLMAHNLRETYELMLVTSRSDEKRDATVAQLERLQLADCKLAMRPVPKNTNPDSTKSNIWKVETITKIAKKYAVAAVFEDNPSVLAMLSQKRIPIVPIYSAYYR